jgi:pimeloyl-ACP methyl ester carboxylesterase
MKNMISKTGLKKLLAAFILLMIVSGNTIGQAKTGYAQVNGLKMYYEIHGTGKPILLIHGAFNSIGTAFSQLIPELAKTRQVIAIELQGHGRTNDIDRAFSFESMADDVAALLKEIRIDSTDILGYSMGGGVAQQVAIRHPSLVRRLILISTVYKYEGWSQETRNILPMLTPEMFANTPIKTEYDKLAPDPSHWKDFINKMKKFVTTTYNFGADKIRSIKSPTLIILGDGDGVTPEHAIEMYRLRGGSYMVDFGPVHAAQLAILPGSSHISTMMQTAWLATMVKPFLEASLQQQ